jgi:hypothetical protein
MPADRASSRLKTTLPVEWAIPSLALKGTGTIRDLSPNGLCLLIDKEFHLKSGSVVFTLKAPPVPLLPRQARLRWFRRRPRVAGESPAGLLCGAIFQFESKEKEEAWRIWLASAVAQEKGG